MRAALIYQHATSERDREIAAGMDKRSAEATAGRRPGVPRKRPDDGEAGAAARVS